MPNMSLIYVTVRTEHMLQVFGTGTATGQEVRGTDHPSLSTTEVVYKHSYNYTPPSVHS